jgi:beta-glucosidase
MNTLLAFMNLPTLEYDLFTADSKRGWIGTWHSHLDDDSMTPIEAPIADRFIDETRIFISTSTPPNITKRWTLKLRGYLKKDYDCKFEFGLTTAGRAKVSSLLSISRSAF